MDDEPTDAELESLRTVKVRLAALKVEIDDTYTKAHLLEDTAIHLIQAHWPLIEKYRPFE